MSRWLVLAVALALGFLLLAYDQRTDDTGVEVALIIGSALACTLAAPRVAVAIALAIGLPIAAYSLGDGHGSAGVVALLFSGAGAFAGWAPRQASRTVTRPG